MSQKFNKLVTLLKELFQLDQPDLDFGLYRIMHAKSGEITQFLEEDLLPQVQAAFGEYQTADKAELEKELAKVIAGVEAAGMNPDDAPKVQELKAKLANEAVDIESLQSEVYDHLYSFFRRYYHEGDFLSKRVYKPGVYAIPYEGEEVKLHWANKDQYYIKTSEYLRDYAFRLRPEDEAQPMRVHFKLVDASEGEHGNVKASEGKDRVFILAPAGESGHDFLSLDNDELSIAFGYRPATLEDWTEETKAAATVAAKKKPPVQSVLLAQAAKAILEVTGSYFQDWIAELARKHLKADGEQAEYSRLEAHLRRYSARNTFDYFIHKDLGGFLKRELDFYIKNEVMHLDDIENETVARAEQYLSKIKVIRKIAGKLIAFLAQLEDFQKKLWLKKKFVVETNYCITLDRIPDEFYPEIAANDAQREEWVRLFSIDEITGEELGEVPYKLPLKSEFLRKNCNLIVDTKFFSEEFKERLLQCVNDLDSTSRTELINSDNFHAIALLRRKYRRKVKGIYIDPPYNSAASEIIYKNDYKHSSWLSMLASRICSTVDLLQENGAYAVAIDDIEFANLQLLLDSIFGYNNRLGNIVVTHNPGGRHDDRFIATAHEYCLYYGLDFNLTETNLMPLEQEDIAKFNLEDDEGKYRTREFRRSGNNSTRELRPKMYYPILIKSSQLEFITDEEYDQIYDSYAKTFNENHLQCLREKYEAEGNTFLLPVDPNGIHRVWRWAMGSLKQRIDDVLVLQKQNGVSVKIKDRLSKKEGLKPKSVWYKPKYTGASGTDLIKNLFGESGLFTYPKSIDTVKDSINIIAEKDAIIVDYYGGSGTSAHAIIELNRLDGGNRKAILVEMGEHFTNVVLPRTKKVTYSSEWKNGKALSRGNGYSHCFKYIRLESYEDALNNLEPRRDDTQQDLLTAAASQGEDGLKEQYMLRYMLDVETRESPSLLNIQAFSDPTAYKLMVKRPGSDESKEVNVDLLETFNYLIGLTVEHIAAPQVFSAEFERDAEQRLMLNGRLKQDAEGPYWFRTVTGTTPDGQKTLVIWRKLTGSPEEDNLVLDEWFTRQGYSTKDSEFQLIYVNGDCTLENLKTAEDTWKVRLLEEDFHRLMFDTEGL